MPEPVMYTASQVATALGTDSKTLRKFLRDEATPYQRVGQGGRYAIDPSELPQMTELFAEWSSNHQSRGKGEKSNGSVPRPRASKASKEAVSPLDSDDLMTRLNSPIAARQRRHGIICSWRIKTKSGTVIELCTDKAVPGTKHCGPHTQLDYCGEPEEAKCGPEFKVPYCKYHAGDISEAEFEALLKLQAE